VVQTQTAKLTAARKRQGFSIRWLPVEITETERSKLFAAILTGFLPVLNILGCKNINWINLAQCGVQLQILMLVVLYRLVLPSPSKNGNPATLH
jgi:hypothetical protein